MAYTPKCSTCRKETHIECNVFISSTCSICLEEKGKFIKLGCGHCLCNSFCF